MKGFWAGMQPNPGKNHAPEAIRLEALFPKLKWERGADYVGSACSLLYCQTPLPF